MSGKSWGHEIRALAAAAIDRNDRFGRTCATGKCQGLPTHVTSWNYTTGRSGHTSAARREVCGVHAQRFAATHGAAIGEPPPPRAVPVDATGKHHPIRVRVHQDRPGGPWYIETRVHTGRLSDVTNQWLSGASAGSGVDEARTIAEEELAAVRRLVPVGGWITASGQATSEVIPAQRHPRYADRAWQADVTCRPDGMWVLTRVLDPALAAITDDLGYRNMTLDRAVGAATALLEEQGWAAEGGFCAGAADSSAFAQAWHPNQVRARTRQHASGR